MDTENEARQENREGRRDSEVGGAGKRKVASEWHGDRSASSIR